MDRLELGVLKARLKSLKFNHKEDKKARVKRVLEGGFKAFVFEYFPHHINFIQKKAPNLEILFMIILINSLKE